MGKILDKKGNNSTMTLRQRLIHYTNEYFDKYYKPLPAKLVAGYVAVVVVATLSIAIVAVINQLSPLCPVIAAVVFSLVAYVRHRLHLEYHYIRSHIYSLYRFRKDSLRFLQGLPQDIREALLCRDMKYVFYAIRTNLREQHLPIGVMTRATLQHEALQPYWHGFVELIEEWERWKNRVTAARTTLIRPVANHRHAC